MPSDYAREVERIVQGALEHPAAEREAFVADACAGDEGLRGDLERLVAHDGGASGFLETPVLAAGRCGFRSTRPSRKRPKRSTSPQRP